MKLTLAQAKAHLKSVGCTLTKVDGEYRVRLVTAKPGDGSGYFTDFTDCIEDAVETGILLAARTVASVPNQTLTATVNRMIASGHPVVVEQPANKLFRVAAISSRTNSFGLSGIILIAKDGLTFEVGRHQHVDPWKRGQTVAVPLTPGFTDACEWSRVGCKIPRVLPKAPAKVVAEVWG